MRSRIVIILTTAMILLTGCSTTCKINGCDNEVYKEGLCRTHYLASEGANLFNEIVGGE